MASYGSGDVTWFKADRFGMFIHWGLYSMAARHEWVRNHECMSDNDYQKYFERFDPDLFKPSEWARAARLAGMKYFVITAKHHEGFCMWDTKFTDYKVTNTPAKRDLLREVIDAFRAEGLHVGIYYSLLDWHHPDFVIDRLHPLRGLPLAEREKLNSKRSMKRYAEYMRDQVTELLTNYGKIDVLWFDYSYPGEDGKGAADWESEKLIRLVRKLGKDIVVDNRLDLPGSGDIVTPEQYTPDSEMTDPDGRPVAWEGCHTFSGSWGYHRDETSWKSADQCVKLLIDHVSRNGNLLMNVGPTSRGCFDRRAIERLNDYAEWMKYNSRSIYNCGAAPDSILAPDCGRYTYNPVTNRLYLHLYSYPFKHINLCGLAGKVAYMQFLHDGSEILFSNASETEMMSMTAADSAVTVHLPVIKPDSVVPVIEIFLK